MLCKTTQLQKRAHAELRGLDQSNVRTRRLRPPHRHGQRHSSEPLNDVAILVVNL